MSGYINRHGEHRDWLETARHCGERVYDGEAVQRVKTGQAKRPGNALCAYAVGIVHRCTFNLCPLRKPAAAPGGQHPEERKES